MGHRLGELHHQAAAFGMPDHGHRRPGRAVEHRECVAHVGIPRVERGVVGIAVASLIPRDDSPARVREQWSEEVERRREVHAAVAQHDRRRVEVAPFVCRDPDAVRVDPAPAVGTPSAWIGQRLLRRRHAPETNGEQPVRFRDARKVLAMRAIATVGFTISLGAVVLSGCGGDDSSSAPPTTAAAAETTTTIATTTTSPEVTYVIQKGDSLSKIAKQFNLTVDQLITINNITDADHIEAGQVLIIVPVAGAPVAPTTTAVPPPAT